jgi:hypothetical protein
LHQQRLHQREQQSPGITAPVAGKGTSDIPLPQRSPDDRVRVGWC